VKTTAIAALLLLLAGFARAQDSDAPAPDDDAPASAAAPGPPGAPNAPPAPPPIARPPRPKLPNMRGLQAGPRKLQDEMIEQLERTNPQAAARLRQRRDEQGKIDAIVRDYRSGRLEEDDARSQLAPLVADDAENDARRIDERLRQLQAKVDFLKRAREDHDLLVRRRVDLLLGKEPDDGHAFDDAPISVRPARPPAAFKPPPPPH